MANAVFYSNVAQQTTLSGSISSGATTINVGATTGFPGSFPYTLALDYGAATEELVSVTAAAGTTLTVTRGYGGTSAQSHSLGAVVRHVYDATDATAFRTHEAATAAIHGVAGTLVGTSDTQTLSNKTLTSPTINSGALSGTFTGNPTLSGTVTLTGTLTGTAATLSGTWAGTPTFSNNVNFTGDPKFTGIPRFGNAVAGTDVLGAQVPGDTFDRMRVDTNGKHTWGTGTASRDTDLFRAGASILGTTSTVNTSPTGTALDAYQANLPAGTSGDLLNLRVNNAIQAAMDSTGAFRIYQGNAPTTFTPTWTGLGTGTLSTNVGWYYRIGKVIVMEIYAVWSGNGSGTAGVQVQFPTVPFRDGNGANTTRQYVFGFIAGSNGGVVDGVCAMPCFAGDAGTTGATLRRFDGINVQGSNLITSSIVTIQGWYREA